MLSLPQASPSMATPAEASPKDCQSECQTPSCHGSPAPDCTVTTFGWRLENHVSPGFNLFGPKQWKKEAKLFISGTITAVKQGANLLAENRQAPFGAERDMNVIAHGAPCTRRPRSQGRRTGQRRRGRGSSTGNTLLSSGDGATRLFPNMCTRRRLRGPGKAGPRYVQVLRQLGSQSFRAKRTTHKDTTGSPKIPSHSRRGGRGGNAAQRRPRG